MISTARIARWRDRVVTYALRRVVLVARSTAVEPPTASTRLPTEIRELDPAELTTYLAFRPEQPEEVVWRRWARGDRCFVAWGEDRIGHAGWSATGRGPIDYLDGDLQLTARDMFLYDSYTRPDSRRAGLSRARYAHLVRYARGAGAHRLLAVVATENRPGLRALAAAGFQPLGLYGLVRGGLWRRYWTRAWGLEPLPPLVPWR